VDDIRLSGTLAQLLAEEKLPTLPPREVEPSSHLARVLERVDYVSSVSIRHELALVQPAMQLPPLQAELAMPAALAPTHLLSFKRWYHERMPLRLTQQADPFAHLQDMLAPKAVRRQV